jgi:hypothetical protein
MLDESLWETELNFVNCSLMDLADSKKDHLEELGRRADRASLEFLHEHLKKQYSAMITEDLRRMQKEIIAGIVPAVLQRMKPPVEVPAPTPGSEQEPGGILDKCLEEMEKSVDAATEETTEAPRKITNMPGLAGDARDYMEELDASLSDPSKPDAPSMIAFLVLHKDGAGSFYLAHDEKISLPMHYLAMMGLLDLQKQEIASWTGEAEEDDSDGPSDDQG